MAKFIVEKLEVTCRDISYQGYGVAVSSDNRVFFVQGLFPGEKAIIQTSYKRNGQVFAEVKQLLVKSSKRIKPVCDTCTSCGGCQFQQLKYDEQLKFKSRIVSEQFNKIGNLNIDALPTIGMEEPYYYRNKIQPKVGTGRYNRIITGFFKKNSHEVVQIDGCSIEDQRATETLGSLRKIFNELEIPSYNEFKKRGVIRNILIRTSSHYNELMLVIITAKKNFPNKDEMIERIKNECTLVTSFYLNINHKQTSVILGDKTIHIFGTKFINDSLCGVNFEISPESFYQTNPRMTEILYDKAMEFANLDKNDIVLDAYSGIGTIGLVASKYCKNVYAVEIVEEAVKDANNNARKNKIDNFVSIKQDATDFMVKAANDKKNVDVVFIDPPRKGSTPECLNAIKELAPKKVIYISCNPSSLARDCKELIPEYKVTKVQPVDMFPMTSHVETVCCLERN